MPRSYFEGIQKKVREKTDLSYLFKSSEEYGTWNNGHKKGKKNFKKKNPLKNFAKEYDDFQNGGR